MERSQEGLGKHAEEFEPYHASTEGTGGPVEHSQYSFGEERSSLLILALVVAALDSPVLLELPAIPLNRCLFRLHYVCALSSETVSQSFC